MNNKLSKIARDTNLFLKKFIKSQNKSPLLHPMNYGLFSGGKKIRSSSEMIENADRFNLEAAELAGWAEGYDEGRESR